MIGYTTRRAHHYKALDGTKEPNVFTVTLINLERKDALDDAEATTADGDDAKRLAYLLRHERTTKYWASIRYSERIDILWDNDPSPAYAYTSKNWRTAKINATLNAWNAKTLAKITKNTDPWITPDQLIKHLEEMKGTIQVRFCCDTLRYVPTDKTASTTIEVVEKLEDHPDDFDEVPDPSKDIETPGDRPDQTFV